MSNIEKYWEEYKESLQQSAYMSRLNLTQREKDFKEGYKIAIEKYGK
jgi:hypothetical protein